MCSRWICFPSAHAFCFALRLTIACLLPYNSFVNSYVMLQIVHASLVVLVALSRQHCRAAAEHA